MSLWAKLYTDILGDPKLMSAARTGATNLELLPWLIAFAKLADCGGRLEINGKRADSRDIAALLPRVRASRVKKCESELLAIGVLVADSDGVSRFANWERRSGQVRKSPSDTTEATRARKRRSRARHEDVTTRDPNPSRVESRGVELELEIEQQRIDLDQERALGHEPGSADEPASAAPPTSEPQPQPAEPVAPVPVSPAHQIPWPEDALEFGRTFYPRGQATDQRRADVHAQITATLNGGCIFRNGLVRASSEQLARRCREVLSAPPSRGDSAIVVLLTKLSDVGNALDSPTERAQAASRVAFADDRTTLAAWRAAHPEDAAAIDAKMLRLFPTPGEIVARQSCADGAIRKRIADDASARTGALKSTAPNGPSP